MKEAAASASQKPEAAGPAEAELRRRVNELIAETLRLVEAGDTEAAQRAIDRILILDEENETAMSLGAKLAKGGGSRTGAAPARGSAPVLFTAAHFGAPSPIEGPAEPEVAEPFDAHPEPLPLARPGAWNLAAPEPPSPPPTPAAQPAFEALTEPGPPAAASTFLDDDLPPLEDLIGEEPSEAEAPRPVLPPTAPRWPQLSLARPRLTPRTMAIAGGVVLVIGLAGWWLWPSGAGESDAGAAGAGAADRPADPRGEGAPEPAAGAATAAPRAAPSPAERLAEAIRQADRAEADGDLGRLVLALAAAAELRPEDAALRDRLTTAAERYKIHEERDAKWKEALAAFEEGSYSQALAYFYRVPADDPRPELERYKLNGWFNLGVLALRSMDCEGARAHLGEARELSASDPDVIRADELAHRCRVGADQGWVEGVSSLRLRALGD
jgi:hypothetical protein